MANVVLTKSECAILPGSPSGFLSRERTIASPYFNRGLMPPATLAIHVHRHGV